MMLLNKIAEQLHVHLIGNGGIAVSGITYADVATEDQIAISMSRSEAMRTAAKVVLTNKILLGIDKTLLFCDGAILKTAKEIGELFVSHDEYPDYALQESYTWQDTGWIAGENVIVGASSHVGAFSCIGKNVQIGSNCIIYPNVYIGAGSIIGSNVIIKPGVRIASPAFFMYDSHPGNDFVGFGKVKIGNNVTIGSNTVVQRGSFADTIIGADTGIGDGVVIGHDVHIGRRCRIVSQAGIAGRSVLGDGVEVMGQAGIVENVNIGEGSIIKAKSLVSKNVPDNEVISGLYGRKHIEEMRLQAVLRKKF